MSRLIRRGWILVALLVGSPSGAQVSVNCPMNHNIILSGVSDISGSYSFPGSANVYVEGISRSLLHPGGTMSARLFVDGRQVSDGTSSNPRSSDDNKAVTTSTTIPVQAGHQYRIRLTSTNHDGDAVSDEVSLTCH